MKGRSDDYDRTLLPRFGNNAPPRKTIGNVLFNGAVNTFYLRLYGAGNAMTTIIVGLPPPPPHLWVHFDGMVDSCQNMQLKRMRCNWLIWPWHPQHRNTFKAHSKDVIPSMQFEHYCIFRERQIQEGGETHHSISLLGLRLNEDFTFYLYFDL